MGGAESRFLKESLALCSVDSTFIFFARATTEANQNKYYVKSSNFAESGDKKDLLRRLPRLDFIKSHNDGIWANYHEYKCDSHNDEKNAILRKNADSSYIAESCKYENKSDSAKTFTRKLHKSPARKVAA